MESRLLKAKAGGVPVRKKAVRSWREMVLRMGAEAHHHLSAVIPPGLTGGSSTSVLAGVIDELTNVGQTPPFLTLSLYSRALPPTGSSDQAGR